MPERTRCDAQFESLPQCESHFPIIVLCKLISPFSPYCLSSMVLYHFKAVVGLFHSKSDIMGHARTSPELWFHEDKILEPKIMLYLTVSAMLLLCYVVRWISA